MDENREETEKEFTGNQIRGLHPVVRTEYFKHRITADQARMANRLIRQPYRFKSRIALRVVRENMSNAGITDLQMILQAMPTDAPAELLENLSFEVLRKNRPLDEAVQEIQEATEAFRKMRKAQEDRPKPPPPPKPRKPMERTTKVRREGAGRWKAKKKSRPSKKNRIRL